MSSGSPVPGVSPNADIILRFAAGNVSLLSGG